MNGRCVGGAADEEEEEADEEGAGSAMPTDKAAPRAAPIVPDERENAVDEFRPSALMSVVGRKKARGEDV
jgi:hypothetical protein